ncbi:MAG: FAD-dependent oxidoreductase, partial [Chloroflexota bacterium]
MQVNANRIAVVGGGITGLAAAYRVNQQTPVTLFEAGQRTGGVVASRFERGYLMEAGPDSFLDKAALLDLCATLGLGAQVIDIQAAHRRSFLVRGR